MVVVGLILLSCEPVKKEEVSIAFTSPSVALPFLVLTPEEARVQWAIHIVSPAERDQAMQQRTVDLAESDFFEMYALALQQRSYESPLKGLAMVKSDYSLVLQASSVGLAPNKKVLGMANLSASDYLLEHWYGRALIDRRHVGSQAMGRQLLREGVLDGAVLGIHERHELLKTGLVKQKSLLNEDVVLGVLVQVNREMSDKLVDDVLHDYRLGVAKLQSDEDFSHVLDPYRLTHDVEYAINYPADLFFSPERFEELSQWVLLRFPFTEWISYEEMFVLKSHP